MRAEIPYSRFELLLQLAGLSLFLATIEMSIPKPMPFLKLGIANLPILLFVNQLKFKELLLVVFFKTFCHSLISGSLLSYIAVFSALSSLASGTTMWLFAQLPKHFSLFGISIIGAASSNGVQLVLALSYFFPGTGSLLIPWSTSFGLGSGALLGLFALQFSRGSLWYESTSRIFKSSVENENFGGFCNKIQTPKITINNCWKNNAALQRFVFGLSSLGLMFATQKYEPIYLVFPLLLFLWLNKLLGYRPWWHSIIILLIVLVFFHLLLPSGKLLWEINIVYFHFTLTQGALERGFGKAFFLLNLMQMSRFAISTELRLPGRLGQMMQLIFFYYQKLLNSPTKFCRTKIFSSLDAILCSVFRGESTFVGLLKEDRQMDSRRKLDGLQLNYVVQGLLLLLQIGIVWLAKYLPLYQLLER